MIRPFDPDHAELTLPWDAQEEGDSPFSSNSTPLPVEEILRQAFQEKELTFDDLLPYRIFASWRLIRRLAAWKGLLRPEESLLEALSPNQSNPDPWVIPPSLASAPSEGRSGATAFAQARQYLIPPQVIRCHLDAQSLNTGFLPAPYTEPITSIPLLPPGIPPACLPIESYTPNKDPLIKFYVTCLKAAAASLDIISGSREQPHMGKWGLAGLLDPWYVRQVFPTRFQIVALEQHLVEETLGYLVGPEKQLNAEQRLKNQYGLDRMEVLSLIRMAKAEAGRRTQGDLENDRSLMLLRLEDFCRRCHQGFDLRSELMALKHMAVVLGLARAETGDMMNDMAEVVRTISQERSRPVLANETEE